MTIIREHLLDENNKWPYRKTHLRSFRVSVKFIHQVHAPFRVHCTIYDTEVQIQLPQVNSYNVQHTGPLGHNYTANTHSC